VPPSAPRQCCVSKGLEASFMARVGFPKEREATPLGNNGGDFTKRRFLRATKQG